MAHYKRRRPRTTGRRNIVTYGHWDNSPRWWDIIFHRRPRRAAERAIERRILAGLVEPDGIAWSLGNSKPHHHYC
jgi:hypothetical protein